MKALQSAFLIMAMFSVSDICLAFHPCPEGTSPDKLQTYPPSILIMLFGVIMIYFFERKIKKQILKRVIQAVFAAVFLLLAFVVFAVLSATAPCV